MPEEGLEVFYLFFGLLRQSIWTVEPRMKELMLRSGASQEQDQTDDC